MKVKLGGEFDQFAASIQQDAPISIRANPKKKFYNNNLNKVPWSEMGFYLSERHSFTLDPAFHAGSYYVQEASSMFVETAIKQAIDLNQPIKVLDLCAAPGGKSTHLLSLLNSQSLLVTNETIRSRATILKENIIKWGYANVIVTNNDPEHFNRLPNFFDFILVDAPCSGEGLFRKDPGSVKHWSEDSVRLCALRQQRIIEQVWPSLRPGGVMLYSTCTYNDVENENNLHAFSERGDLEFLDLSLEEDWGIEKVVKGSVIGYRFFPHRVQGEGFFISLFRKKGNDIGQQRITSGKYTLKFKSFNLIKDLIVNPEEKLFREHKNKMYFVSAVDDHDMEKLIQHLHVVSAGTAIGMIKNSKLIPDHALALSTELNQNNFNTLDLTKEQALTYLRKENLTMVPEQLGLHLVRYDGNPIGWANCLPNRINNLYPTDWRIRMR